MESNYKKVWILHKCYSKQTKKPSKFIISYREHSCFKLAKNKLSFFPSVCCCCCNNSLEMIALTCVVCNCGIFVCLLFVFIFCAMFQNSSEFNVVKESIFDGRLTVHFINIFIGKTVTHCGQQFT